jgi:hypothetical protein
VTRHGPRGARALRCEASTSDVTPRSALRPAARHVRRMHGGRARTDPFYSGYPRRGCHVAGAQPPRGRERGSLPAGRLRRSGFPLPRTPPVRSSIQFAVQPLSPGIRPSRCLPAQGPRGPSRSCSGPALPNGARTTPTRTRLSPTPSAAHGGSPTSVPTPCQRPLPPRSLPPRSHFCLERADPRVSVRRRMCPRGGVHLFLSHIIYIHYIIMEIKSPRGRRLPPPSPPAPPPTPTNRWREREREQKLSGTEQLALGITHTHHHGDARRAAGGGRVRRDARTRRVDQEGRGHDDLLPARLTASLLARSLELPRPRPIRG